MYHSYSLSRMRIIHLSFVILLLCNLIVNINSSFAVVKIDINQGNIQPIPIAIGEFEYEQWESRDIGQQVTELISHDLEGSGLFKIIEHDAFLERPSMGRKPVFSNWRKIGAAAIVSGSAHVTEQGELLIKFNMWDPYGEALMVGSAYKVEKKAWRRVAHKIADKVYNKMTGESGYFDTRILFVAEKGSGKKIIKKLAIMDQDGANFRVLTDGRDLVLTPRFDPQSHRAIYMTYKDKVPHVYILDIDTGKQRLVSNVAGMSFAPRFSPDGKKAIMSIAKGGSTNIYEIDLGTGALAKLTHETGTISTSPSYSPDGRKIVFNSDRAGSRQLYIMNRDGSDIARLSYGDGTYATPVWSPRGDFIAFTKILRGSFYIGVMRYDGTEERLLTTSWLDEGPTWSPNGRIIMFKRQEKGGESQLYSIDLTGYNGRKVKTPVSASDPAWSPLLP